MIDQPEAVANAPLQTFLADARAALKAVEAEKNRLRRDLAQEDLQKRLADLVDIARGASGRLMLPRLEAVATATAGVLDVLRSEQIAPTPGIVMLVLGSLDRMRDLLDGVAEFGREPEGDDSLLLGALAAVPDTVRLLLGEETAPDVADLVASAMVDDDEDEAAPASGLDDLPIAGGAFLLFRQGHVLRALDLEHVVWIDLLDRPPQRNDGGELEVRVQGSQISLVGFEEVHARNPQGPWSFVVIDHGGRWAGVFVDEIQQVVEDPELIRRAGRQAKGAEPLRIRVASPDDFF